MHLIKRTALSASWQKLIAENTPNAPREKKQLLGASLDRIGLKLIILQNILKHRG